MFQREGEAKGDSYELYISLSLYLLRAPVVYCPLDGSRVNSTHI